MTNGAVIAVGDLRNSGTVANAGMLVVTGDWLNAGTYAAQTGLVSLTGAGQQRIRHQGQPFFGLFVTGGRKILEDSATITNRLELVNTVVEAASGTWLLMRKTASISGAASNAYVDGALYWEGVHERFYPVGRQGVYAPLWLTAEPASGTVDPIVGIALANPPTNFTTDTSLRAVSAVRHWERTVKQGQSAQAMATLSVLADEQHNALDSLVVAGTDDATFRSLGQSGISGTASSGTVTSSRPVNTKWLAVGTMARPSLSELIYIPTAFAPGSAHAEERVFKVYGPAIAPNGLRLTVYNRWGGVVFDSQSVEDITRTGWDGVNQTTRQPEIPGVYTYILRGKQLTGQAFQRTGTVTLLR